MKTLNRLETIKKVCREYGGDIHQRKSYVNDEIRDGKVEACPRAWPERAHCGAGLGTDFTARLLAGLAGMTATVLGRSGLGLRGMRDNWVARLTFLVLFLR